MESAALDFELLPPSSSLRNRARLAGWGALIHPSRNVVRVQFTIAAVLALTPLLILPGSFFYYDVTPKIVVVLAGTAIGIVLCLRDSPLNQVRRCWADPMGRSFCILATAQIVCLLLSTCFSSNPALSWNGGNWRRLGLVSQSALAVVALFIALSCSRSGLRVLLRSITLAGTAAAFYGILQYFGVDPILPSAAYHVGEGVLTIVRPPSTMGHADYFAGYLLYVVFGGAALLATESKATWRTLGTIAAAAGSAAVVLSGTRGALLGLVVGAASLWVWNRPAFRRRHAILAAALCGAVLAFYCSPAGLKLRARKQWAVEDLRGGARFWLWRDSLRMAGQHFIVGFGPETFGLEFPRYQSVELSSAYPDFYHESPHNIFLDALVSDGIPGLSILAGFAALGWLAARRAARQGQPAAPYLASALVAGLTAGLFVCFTLPGALYFYATVAMLTGLAIPPATSWAEPRSRFWEQTPAFALALTAVATFLYFAVRLTAADLTLEQATRSLDSGRIEDSLKAYQWSQRWHLAGSSDDLYFSRTLLVASRTATNPAMASMASQYAFSTARRATETSEERQNAWYNLAEFYAARNDAPAVEECLRRSVDASPTWFKSHWALSQVLLLTGHRTEALAEAERASDLNGGRDPEIAKFLHSVHDYSASRKPE
jgi:O-antigen ligase